MASPLSTAERGHGEPMLNVFDRRPPPIQDMKPAPTVPTSLKTRSRAGGISQFPPSLSVASGAWGHDAPTQRESTVNGSTSRLFDARRCPLRARVLSASIYLREHSHKHAAQLYHQPGSQLRQGPRKTGKRCTELGWVYLTGYFQARTRRALYDFKVVT